MKEELPFPRFIDKPRLVGIFEMDEFMLAFSLMSTTLALSLLLPELNSTYVMLASIIIGLGSAAGYKKFKNSRTDGYTLQKLYRAGIFSPQDNKKAMIKYKYLRRGLKMLPYGFTKVFYN